MSARKGGVWGAKSTEQEEQKVVTRKLFLAICRPDCCRLEPDSVVYDFGSGYGKFSYVPFPIISRPLARVSSPPQNIL